MWRSKCLILSDNPQIAEYKSKISHLGQKSGYWAAYFEIILCQVVENSLFLAKLTKSDWLGLQLPQKKQNPETVMSRRNLNKKRENERMWNGYGEMKVTLRLLKS